MPAHSADAEYEAIRGSLMDVEEIARNTGLKPANVERVKNHLFLNEHLLDRYVDLGIPAEWKRFDSDRGIAEAWHRLRRGDILKRTCGCCGTRRPKRGMKENMVRNTARRMMPHNAGSPHRISRENHDAIFTMEKL